MSSPLQSLDLEKTVLFELGEKGTYVFQLRMSLDGNLIACSASNSIIKLYNSSFQLVCQFEGHQKRITDLKFINNNLIVSCSQDKTAIIWDIITKKIGQQYKHTEELCSVDVNTEQKLVIAGSENGTLSYWSMETAEIRRYNRELHSTAVTQTLLHPFQRNKVFTASVDGLVCLSDITVEDGNDCLLQVFPIDTAVQRIGFFGPKFEHLYVLTGDETLQLWDLDKSEKTVEFGTDFREKLSLLSKVLIQYVIDCNYNKNSNQMFLLAGNHKGDIIVFLILNEKTILPVFTLENGHKATVRDICWNPSTQALTTVGEDSRVCFWKPTKKEMSKDTRSEVGKIIPSKTRPKYSPY